MPTIPEYVVLYNKDRYKPFEASMYHSVCCTEDFCYCSYKDEHVSRLGKIRIERNFRIEPRGYSKALPRVILNIPQVDQARRLGQLKVANMRAEIQHYPGK